MPWTYTLLALCAAVALASLASRLLYWLLAPKRVSVVLNGTPLAYCQSIYPFAWGKFAGIARCSDGCQEALNAGKRTTGWSSAASGQSTLFCHHASPSCWPA